MGHCDVDDWIALVAVQGGQQGDRLTLAHTRAPGNRPCVHIGQGYSTVNHIKNTRKTHRRARRRQGTGDEQSHVSIRESCGPFPILKVSGVQITAQQGTLWGARCTHTEQERRCMPRGTLMFFGGVVVVNTVGRAGDRGMPWRRTRQRSLQSSFAKCGGQWSGVQKKFFQRHTSAATAFYLCHKQCCQKG